MLTKLYLDTTNPELTISQFFSYEIFSPMIYSLLFHTVIYMSFLNAVNYIFTQRILSSEVNLMIFVFLIIFMFFGFIARFHHVKEIYSAYNKDVEKTREHLDKLYISWLFIS